MHKLAALVDAGLQVLVVRQRRDQVDLATQGGGKLVLQIEVSIEEPAIVWRLGLMGSKLQIWPRNRP